MWSKFTSEVGRVLYYTYRIGLCTSRHLAPKQWRVCLCLCKNIIYPVSVYTYLSLWVIYHFHVVIYQKILLHFRAQFWHKTWISGRGVHWLYSVFLFHSSVWYSLLLYFYCRWLLSPNYWPTANCVSILDEKGGGGGGFYIKKKKCRIIEIKLKIKKKKKKKKNKKKKI